MALTSRAVTVAASATRLDKVADVHLECGIAVFNNDASATLYIGGSDVTTSNGCPVPPSTWSPSIVLAVDEALYGIVAAATLNARVLEAGV